MTSRSSFLAACAMIRNITLKVMMRALIACGGALWLTASAAGAQATGTSTATTYGFLTHAAFFSLESRQANLLDPQVFVADPSAPAATGPQGIEHSGGFRPAYAVEDPATPLANAQGRPLGFTLRQWFGAHGTAALAAHSPTDTTVQLSFEGLVPGARYSLFENHFAPAGVTFTPLDGAGKTNSFTAGADGSAKTTIVAPGAVTHAEGILLVYHSDAVDHGMQRGMLGVTAHHQLIIRLP